MIYPAAIWLPGPPGKVWAGMNAIEGAILHSMGGSLAASLSWLAEDAVDEWGRYIAPSWHFSIGQDGTSYQHYPLDACCWHAGSEQANRRYVGIEHEGTAGEPLTAAQEAASVALTRWVAQQGGWTPARLPATPQTLWEHHEVNPATTCPNGRITWAAYTEPAISPEPNKVALIYAIFRGEVMRLPVQDGKNRYEIRLPVKE